MFYFKDRKSSLNNNVKLLLAVLRCCTVSLIAFLLLSPLVKQKMVEEEKPIVIVAQDNSSSVLYCKDSSFYRGEYKSLLQNTIEKLEDDYEVHTYTFGEKIDDAFEINFSDKKTNISDLFQHITNVYTNRNIGAILLCSDGLYNSGHNPLAAAEASLHPIYTVGMGDTSLRKDAYISNVKHNKIAYLGNKFPVEIAIKATMLGGQNSKLIVQKNGKQIFSKDIKYTEDNFSTTIPLVLDADIKGLQHYKIVLERCNGEVSDANNVRNITIDVIDGKQKVAILAHSPHPDVAAIKHSIADNENYDVETFLAKDFDKPLAEYNLIILHQIPTTADYKGMELVEKIKKEDIPVLFIIGEQTAIPQLNQTDMGLKILSKINQHSDVTPLYNSEFTQFILPQEVYSKFEHFPPLSAPFGEYKTATNSQSLFMAKVGNVSSGNPMIMFVQKHNVRYGFIIGEGLWRWPLADYAQNGTADNFNTLIDKMVMYLSLKISKDRFRVVANNSYIEAEPVTFEAEFYNESYELTNTPDVLMSITDSAGNEKQYHFNRVGATYHLNIGSLSAGRYTYKATTAYGNKSYKAEGNFVVEPIMLEDINLVADHTLLNTLSQKTGGELLSARNISDLPEMIKKRTDIKTVMYEQLKYSEILNMPWLFVLIILLLGSEWVIRKYNGEI
ncbi:MAG: hypothetical protein IKY43_05310, partial [Bacteroidales bacterium]|nr:hypothetical protein [Bacteroidales bacterium]